MLHPKVLVWGREVLLHCPEEGDASVGDTGRCAGRKINTFTLDEDTWCQFSNLILNQSAHSN